MCRQRRLRLAWASSRSDQSLHCALSRYMVLRAQCFFMRTAKTLIRLGGCPGWSESSLGVHVILLVLSCCSSNPVLTEGEEEEERSWAPQWGNVFTTFKMSYFRTANFLMVLNFQNTLKIHLFNYYLIFSLLMHFPAILLVKKIGSYLNEWKVVGSELCNKLIT